jgi:drug/metabolite transporter (DMT)-like permease
MIAQAALFAAETGVIHQIGPHASVMQLSCLRGAAGVILALVVAKGPLWETVRTRHLPVQLLRGGVALLYLWVMIYSFRRLPFGDATAISYTQTAYIAIFSVVILGESVTGRGWASAVIGIGGAIIVAKPAFSGWTSAYLIAVLGTSLNGLSFVLNRYLQRDDSQATTMFYTNVVPAIGSAPLALFAGVPEARAMMWLPAIALLGPIGVYCGIVATRHAEAAVLGPFTLLRLVIALSAGTIIFRETPDPTSAVGAVLILASCILSSGYDVPLRWLRSMMLKAAADRPVIHSGAPGPFRPIFERGSAR